MKMKILTRITVWVLKHSQLKAEDRLALTTAILDELHALPFRGIIETDQTQRLLLNGRAVDKEQAIKLRIAAGQLRSNYARQYFREHIDFQAVKEGMYRSYDPLSQVFAKAAIWLGQEEEKFFELLAGEATSAFNDEE